MTRIDIGWVVLAKTSKKWAEFLAAVPEEIEWLLDVAKAARAYRGFMWNPGPPTEEEKRTAKELGDALNRKENIQWLR